MDFPQQIATGFLFFRFAYLAILGLLQIVAARHRRRDLSLLAHRPGVAYTVGFSLVLGGYFWFFGTNGEEILAPGPASSEFTFFLSLALVLALLTSALPARLLLRGQNLDIPREET